jgi:hypothetical protein
VGDLGADGTPEVVAGTQNLSGNLVPVVFVLDGDAGIGAIFLDDFESGDTARWATSGAAGS